MAGRGALRCRIRARELDREQLTVARCVMELLALRSDSTRRFALRAACLSVGILVEGLLGAPPSLHMSAWYFGNLAFLSVSAIALVVWAFTRRLAGGGFGISLRVPTDQILVIAVPIL
jgi:hypothetical protein